MMKKLLLLFAIVAFAACSEDNDPVVPVRPTGIELNETTAALVLGKTLQLTAVLTPADANGTLVWTSDDKAVATVTDAGLMTAIAVGKTTITVSCGEVSASCVVTVAEPIKPTSIELNETTAALVLGKTLQLTAVVTPADANGTLVWTSDDKAVVTVTDAGLVTAVAVGKTTITASCGEVSASCEFTIKNLYDVISFEIAEKMTDFKGKPVVPADVTLVGGIAAGTYKNVFMGLAYAEEEGVMGLTFDDPLFSTAVGNVWFGSFYCDGTGWGMRMDTWCGIVLSKNYNSTASKMDYKDQFSVYALKGANGTETFAACYDGAMFGGAYSAPIIEFTEPRTVDHLYLANSTMLVTYESSKTDYTFTVQIIGSLDGKEVGKLDVVLATAKSVTKEWVKSDLTKLGKIDNLKFKVVSNDSMAPTYFCIDEITVNN